MAVDWKNLFKVRLAMADPSMNKHDVIKTLLVRKILYKNRRRKDWIRIYTEFELDNGCKADVYFEDVKTKEAIAYEIQKELTNSWLERKKKQYAGWEVPLFNSADLIVIPLEEFSNDINEINEKLEEYIV